MMIKTTAMMMIRMILETDAVGYVDMDVFVVVVVVNGSYLLTCP